MTLEYSELRQWCHLLGAFADFLSFPFQTVFVRSFTSRQRLSLSHSKQKINSVIVFSICSTRPGYESAMTGEMGDRSRDDLLEWPCSLTFHILPAFLLPGVVQPPAALSGSSPWIHDTDHSSASWKQHLTVVVAMGGLPCDHPRRGTEGGKARLSLRNLSRRRSFGLYKGAYGSILPSPMKAVFSSVHIAPPVKRIALKLLDWFTWWSSFSAIKNEWEHVWYSLTSC